MKKRAKRKPSYKQMAFETAIRNPERYMSILAAVKKFENKILNDKTLLEIVSHLYLVGEVSSSEITIEQKTKISDIKSTVEQVNSTRKADGGFPQGFASRFWTYMRTPSELGFVYVQYNKRLKFSKIAKKLLGGEIDEQEAFSIQAMKYNRKSPFRNVSNDFNFFSFILKVILKLKESEHSLSFEQFIVASFSKSGNVDECINTLNNNKFKDYNQVYEFVKREYQINTKINTVTKDYPDVVRRVLQLSGFITIRYSGKKFIQINENKLNYIKGLLKIDFELIKEEKSDALQYFQKLDTKNKEFLNLVKKYRKDDKINAEKYTNQLFNIIKTYKINEKIISKSIEKIGSRGTIIEEFKEIPDPLKLEFYISILLAIKYGKEFNIRPNYKADHIGKPYSHAPGNRGDIEIFSNTIYWLVEVTLIRNKAQQLNNETTSVMRHLTENAEFKGYLNKYLSFVAPCIHHDTKNFFEFSLVNSSTHNYKISLKPYTINEFVETTKKKNNLKSMEEYTQKVFKNFRDKLS